MAGQHVHSQAPGGARAARPDEGAHRTLPRCPVPFTPSRPMAIVQQVYEFAPVIPKSFSTCRAIAAASAWATTAITTASSRPRGEWNASRSGIHTASAAQSASMWARCDVAVQYGDVGSTDSRSDREELRHTFRRRRTCLEGWPAGAGL